MYNFESQQKMLSVSLALLEEKGIKNISAIGGGTALAAYYWDHRYSTDIDIFIYGGRTEYKDTLRPAYWSDDIKDLQNAPKGYPLWVQQKVQEIIF